MVCAGNLRLARNAQKRLAERGHFLTTVSEDPENKHGNAEASEAIRKREVKIEYFARVNLRERKRAGARLLRLKSGASTILNA
jgi:hypothetical protein